MPQTHDKRSNTAAVGPMIADSDKVLKNFIRSMDNREIKRKDAAELVKALEYAAANRAPYLTDYIDTVLSYIEIPSLTIIPGESAFSHWFPIVLRSLTSKDIVPLLSAEQFVRLAAALCNLVSTKDMHPKAIGLLFEAIIAIIVTSDDRINIIPQPSIVNLEEVMDTWTEQAFFVENPSKRNADANPSGSIRKLYSHLICCSSEMVSSYFVNKLHSRIDKATEQSDPHRLNAYIQIALLVIISSDKLAPKTYIRITSSFITANMCDFDKIVTIYPALPEVWLPAIIYAVKSNFYFNTHCIDSLINYCITFDLNLMNVASFAGELLSELYYRTPYAVKIFKATLTRFAVNTEPTKAQTLWSLFASKILKRPSLTNGLDRILVGIILNNCFPDWILMIVLKNIIIGMRIQISTPPVPLNVTPELIDNFLTDALEYAPTAPPDDLTRVTTEAMARISSVDYMVPLLLNKFENVEKMKMNTLVFLSAITQCVLQAEPSLVDVIIPAAETACHKIMGLFYIHGITPFQSVSYWHPELTRAQAWHLFLSLIADPSSTKIEEFNPNDFSNQLGISIELFNAILDKNIIPVKKFSLWTGNDIFSLLRNLVADLVNIRINYEDSAFSIQLILRVQSYAFFARKHIISTFVIWALEEYTRVFQVIHDLPHERNKTVHSMINQEDTFEKLFYWTTLRVKPIEVPFVRDINAADLMPQLSGTKMGEITDKTFVHSLMTSASHFQIAQAFYQYRNYPELKEYFLDKFVARSSMYMFTRCEMVECTSSFTIDECTSLHFRSSPGNPGFTQYLRIKNTKALAYLVATSQICHNPIFEFVDPFTAKVSSDLIICSKDQIYLHWCGTADDINHLIELQENMFSIVGLKVSNYVILVKGGRSIYLIPGNTKMPLFKPELPTSHLLRSYHMILTHSIQRALLAL